MARRNGITLRGHDAIAAFFSAQGFDNVPGVKHDALKEYRELAVAIHLNVASQDVETAAQALKARVDQEYRRGWSKALKAASGACADLATKSTAALLLRAQQRIGALSPPDAKGGG